jgi:hypothetical protein
VPTLFGPRDQKVDTKNVVEAFHDRLQTIAGFQNVLEPLPMRNSKGAVIYYLFFASQKPVATRIVKDIFGKYMNRGIF